MRSSIREWLGTTTATDGQGPATPLSVMVQPTSPRTSSATAATTPLTKRDDRSVE